MELPRVAAEGRLHKSASGLNGPSRTESVEPNKVVKIRSEGCEILGVPNVPHHDPHREAEESHIHKALSELSGPGHEKPQEHIHRAMGLLGILYLSPQSTRGGSSAQIGLRTNWSKLHGVGRGQ